MKKCIQPQGTVGQLCDWLILPIMYVLQGTVYETPQRTHIWNNLKLNREVLKFTLPLCEGFVGNPSACKSLWLGFIPRFHMPLFGGWRTFVVLQAATNQEEQWFIGWFHETGPVGVSKIPLSGPVRMTIGPDPVCFFAFTKAGEQLPLQRIGQGKIGEAGEFRHVPLL